MPNRLVKETSPYLLQHANNPVDWYAWGDEALERARAENKPILLSVGYSACHWCHVMAHESFENDEIAKFMNENFVNIKVDREERPDLDQIYQNVAQLMTRSGGWPLTVFLTPDLRPFFGGTYFPPEDRYGRPGFPRVLQALAQAYRDDFNSVEENAGRLTHALSRLENVVPEKGELPDAKALREVADLLLKQTDWRNGGFGGAPKFPNPMNLSFLWRYGQASTFGMAQDAVLVALTRMASGGIYDQLGGGFHRYSVDERWAVPHFEKMLYDNGLLLKLYAEVLLTENGQASAADRALYTEVLSQTTGYVLREMTSPEGAFYSAQDADSEGEEGRFFTWTLEQLRQVLPPTETEAFGLRYGVTEEGNFENSGKTVLYQAMPVADVAARLHKSEAETEQLLSSARVRLFAERDRRVHPGRDDKAIASWNGLMISGLVWAARALKSQGRDDDAGQALEGARSAMEFIRARMIRREAGQERLWSVYKNGQARLNGYLDDYAFLALAALDLAGAVADQREAAGLVAQARSWVDSVRRHFDSADHAGFYFTSEDHEKLIQRPRTLYDQAIPSGNAVMIELLFALGATLGEPTYEAEGQALLARLFPLARQFPQGMGELSAAALLAHLGPVTVAGPGSEASCVHPYVLRKPAEAGADLVVCHRNTCDLPQASPVEARKLALSKLQLAS